MEVGVGKRGASEREDEEKRAKKNAVLKVVTIKTKDEETS